MSLNQREVLTMGTRAAFWLGDPRKADARKWLGCIAWDGYPENKELHPLLDAKSESDFLKAVRKLSAKGDFAKPNKGWPFPWTEDVFLTDYTYAWIDGKVQVACYHSGFRDVDPAMKTGKYDWPEKNDPTTRNVSSGLTWDRSQPDSIIIIG
jgi:hypothetical protein